MPPRRNQKKFQQLMVFERGRLSVFEKEYLTITIGARVQRISSTVTRIWSRRAPNNSKNWQWLKEGYTSENHRRLRLQWAYEHRVWQADWHQAVLVEESRFNLWDHDGHILASLELSFNRIMHALMLQRLFETSVQPHTCNFFLALLIHSDMSAIEYVWDLIDQRRARDPCPAASRI
ncbi:hypothetical protein TNCV_480931 [Trichonephila clavipes]|nr:hypothetical protein TNCV_480931 [Trichonephila clavipes]